MKPILSFFIPSLPATPNQLLRRHWSIVMKEKKKWHGLVGLCSMKYQGQPLEKAKLKLTRCSTRQPDFDGLTGSFKFIVDALVKAKVIIDDKYEVIGESEYCWEKCKRDEQGIRVEVSV
ncbi:MAG: hypothetical protein ACXVB1_08960 [Pseudobdellovibrionaceae bacterium]